MTNNPPILITGSHRSGTTWVGNLLKEVIIYLLITGKFD